MLLHRLLIAVALLGSLAASAAAQTGRALTLPARVSGTLTASSEQVKLTLDDDIRPADRYTFTLSPGQSASVRMESTAFDTYLKVFRDGTVAARNDDHEGSREVSQVVLSQPGDYTVLAGAFSGTTNTGPYTLVVTSPNASPASATQARQLAVPSTVRGELSAASSRVPLTLADDIRPADTYSFTLQQGQTVTVRMASSAFDTYLKVFRDGTFHQRNDDHEGSRDLSQVELTLPGQYLVLAGAFGDGSDPGAYELAVILGDERARSEPGPNRDGGTLQGTLTDDDPEVALIRSGSARKADSYSVELRAGEVLVATMESTAFDTYLAVAHDGHILARNDDDGSTQRSHLRYTAVEDGQHYVFTGTFSEAGRGSYTFTWRVE